MAEVEYEVVVRVYRNGRRIGPIVSVLGDDVAFALEGAATEVETTIQPLAESGDSEQASRLDEQQSRMEPR